MASEHTCTHAGVSTWEHVCYCDLDRDHQSWESA